MNRTEYVKANFKPTGEQVTVNLPTGEKKKGLLGGEKEVTRKETQWQQTGWSDREIDGVRLAEDIANKVAELNSEGYEVISITPVTSGDYSWKYQTQGGGGGNGGWGYGYGYGYSYTEGVVVIARKIA